MDNFQITPMMVRKWLKQDSDDSDELFNAACGVIVDPMNGDTSDIDSLRAFVESQND